MPVDVTLQRVGWTFLLGQSDAATTRLQLFSCVKSTQGPSLPLAATAILGDQLFRGPPAKRLRAQHRPARCDICECWYSIKRSVAWAQGPQLGSLLTRTPGQCPRSARHHPPKTAVIER